MDHQPFVEPSIKQSTHADHPPPLRARSPRSCRKPGLHLRLIDTGVDANEAATFQCVTSDDGGLVVLLRRIEHGSGTQLCVERVQRTTPTEIVSHLMLFQRECDFFDWCDADVIRFSPHVVSQARRIAHELLEPKR